ncbi:MAG: hypothetical protein GY938_27245 [Ketobacter sp.]|nr:hypothetical protein [Ketobacter sp.]
MKYETKSVYKVYEISDDGLLKTPAERVGYEGRAEIFNCFGYATMELAIADIEKKSDGVYEYVVLPVVQRNWVR